MRAREAASGWLDGELSELEAVRLDAHLRHCAECREFAAETAAFTTELRGTPLERPVTLTFEPSRQHVRALRMHGTVAAAMVVIAAASVALGRVQLSASGPTSRPAPARGTSGNLAAIRHDAAQQRLLAMLPAADRWRAELQNLPAPAF